MAKVTITHLDHTFVVDTKTVSSRDTMKKKNNVFLSTYTTDKEYASYQRRGENAPYIERYVICPLCDEEIIVSSKRK